MKLYTLKVDNGDGIENIWSGNEIETMPFIMKT